MRTINIPTLSPTDEPHIQIIRKIIKKDPTDDPHIIRIIRKIMNEKDPYVQQ